MRDENKLTEQESLSIIQRMIATAKTEQKDDGKGWILWGWMLFLASILTILNIRFNWFSTFFFWNMFGAASFIIMLVQIINNRFFRRVESVRTYTGDLFKKLNAGFFISLIFIILSINLSARYMGEQGHPVSLRPIIIIGFALLMNLYAFWILIYGAALSFKPSIIGACITWASGITGLFVREFEHIMWLHALAVICGYIIPGHIAYREFNNERRLVKTESV